jgi:hypothetical protein
MIEMQLLWAWVNTRYAKIREQGDDAGFSTVEWVGLAGVVVVAAIVVATIIMNKAKVGAEHVNVQ